MKNVNRGVKKDGHLQTSIINTGKGEITNEQFSIIYTTIVDWRKNRLHRDYADIRWILTDFHSHEIIPTKFDDLMIIFKPLTIAIHVYVFIITSTVIGQRARLQVGTTVALLLMPTTLPLVLRLFCLARSLKRVNLISSFLLLVSAFLIHIDTSSHIVFLKTSSRKNKIYFSARKFRKYNCSDGQRYSWQMKLS